MRGPHLQSHVTYRPRGLVRNQKLCISTFTKPMDPKLSRVVTQDEGNPPAKSRATSIVWSRDKSKLFYLHFHKAQGPQTLEDGHQNEKTLPHMSCATSITPSRDNYVVGSIHLFHFQLKLFPKNRQISNDYDNTENVQLVQSKFLR